MPLLVTQPFHVPGDEAEQKQRNDLLTDDEERVVKQPGNETLLAKCVRLSDEAAQNVRDAAAAHEAVMRPQPARKPQATTDSPAVTT